MAGLPHFDNSTAAVNYYEPLFLNQFEVIITPPSLIAGATDGLLVEHVKKISGLPELTGVGTVNQFYKFAKRTYATGAPKETTATLTIDFEVNLNEENDAYIYNKMRAWGDLTFDPLNGRQGLKADYIGEIYVAIFNKAQDIYREFRFNPAYLTGGLNTMDLDYTADKIHTVTAKFQCDAFKETRIGAIEV
jgi:hypothetical protein